MSRATAALDRFASIVLGLLLIAAGAALLVWRLDTSQWFRDPLVGPLNLPVVADLPKQAWWPWATGLVGVLLALLVLRWIVGHRVTRGRSNRPLPGSAPNGRLVLDLGALAGTAADALAAQPGVEKAKGRILGPPHDGAVELTATIDPLTPLSTAGAAVQAVAEQLQLATDGTVPARYQVKVGRRR
ncbi:hypothetical protein [Knoellia koreensis]|uniref:Alkaline shock response membrane anchor protein AmaP n=1 Tax=Knoellia koreensis TaxID=2730921 RepID=A0A849H8P1_9MICO|nr:hypothetical protein [Knoellia sp. DB2414S]NNM46220.1 hypothetical protein [Knoellia sp. DB2414S]